MSEERRRILDMLAAGKITVEEAENLLAAVSSPEETGATQGKQGCRYLRIVVDPGPDSEKGERVNIRVPLRLIRAGLKFAAFIPKHAHHRVSEALHEKGIDLDLNKITPEDLEEIVTQLNDLTIDVEGKEKVRICCE